MKTKVSLQGIRLFTLALVAGFGCWQVSLHVHAQKSEKPKTAHPSSTTRAKSATAKKSDAPTNNPEYAAKIKEFTTQSYFMT